MWLLTFVPAAIWAQVNAGEAEARRPGLPLVVTQDGKEVLVGNTPPVLADGGGMLGVFISPHYTTDQSIYLTDVEPGRPRCRSEKRLWRFRNIGETQRSISKLRPPMAVPGDPMAAVQRLQGTGASTYRRDGRRNPSIRSCPTYFFYPDARYFCR